MKREASQQNTSIGGRRGGVIRNLVPGGAIPAVVLILLSTLQAAAQPDHVKRVNAQALWSAPFSLNGEGQSIGIFEFERYPAKSHPEFKNPNASITFVSPVAAPLGSHPTQVLGVILARGANAAARGLARKASADMYAGDYTIKKYLDSAGTRSWTISNHSYGWIRGWIYLGGSWRWMGSSESSNANTADSEDPLFGYYDSWAQKLDALLFNKPTQIPVIASGNQRGLGPDGAVTYHAATSTPGMFVNSTVPHPKNGSDGYDVLASHAVSKNAIIVGAVDMNGTIWPRSSTGPTDDGRIKPDLVALGVDVTAASSGSDPNGYDTQTDGTSLAAPAVSGSLLLLRQYWGKFFSVNDFTSAVARGLLIHTANDLGPNGPDYQYGWGCVNARKAADYITLNSENGGFTIRRKTLEQGKSYEFYIKAYANQYLKVTMAWTDPAGTPVSYVNGFPPVDNGTRMLVNDLDVRLYPVYGNTVSEEFPGYPYVLDRTKPSDPAEKGDNKVDNVEQVYFRSQTQLNFQHIYKVVVRHKGTLTGGKQDFALIVGGAVEYVPAPTDVIVNAGKNREKSNSPLAAGNSAVVAWSAVPGASKYDVEYRIVGSQSWTAISNLANTEVLLKDLQDANYQVRVRARNGNVVSPWTSVVQFMAGNPVAPKNAWHTNLTQTGATINWSAVPGVTQYNLKWARIGGDNNVLGTWKSVTVNGTSSPISQLVPDGRYVAYVRSKYSNNLYSDWSPSVSFYTPVDCSVYEESNTIANARTIRPGDYAHGLLCKGDKEDWFRIYNPAGYGNLKVILYGHSQPYRVSVYRGLKGSGDVSLLPGSPAPGLGTKIFTLNGANFNTYDYYIQVWTSDPNVNYSNSETYTLGMWTQAAPYAATTGGNESRKEVKGESDAKSGSLLLYPNPARGGTTVQFTAAEAGASVRLLLYDAAGREVYSTTRTAVMGLNEASLPLNGIPAGIYFVVLETGEGRSLRRLSVVE